MDETRGHGLGSTKWYGCFCLEIELISGSSVPLPQGALVASWMRYIAGIGCVLKKVGSPAVVRRNPGDGGKNVFRPERIN
jgi:hypothetical protein